MGRHTAAIRLALAAAALTCAGLQTVSAAPSLVIDEVTGEVLHQEDATRPWYPASLTKLMTVYVALKAIRDGRVTMDTPFVVSARATRAAPSKMGFKPGTEVTLDNALKILMVKSANDIAIMIAEGIGGSVEDFAVEMNRAAALLGMRDSHFVNPNGLHAPDHVSSARDMAILARALYRDFPDKGGLYGIGALQLGTRIIPTHNGLMGRYPGADGMKTGFVCASGFNVVASATRGNRKLIAVVMGSPNARARTIKAAGLFDAAFAGQTRSGGNISSMGSVGGGAPNMRETICGRGRQNLTEDDLAVVVSTGAASGGGMGGADDSPARFFANDGMQQRTATTSQIQMGGPRPYFAPIPIFIGRAPGYSGPVAMARGGAAPQKPATAAAFAAQKPRVIDENASPITADPTALPMRSAGRKKPVGIATARAIEDEADKPATKKTKPKKAEAKKTEAKKPAGKAPVTAEKPAAAAKTAAVKPVPTKPAAAKPAAAKPKPAAADND